MWYCGKSDWNSSVFRLIKRSGIDIETLLERAGGDFVAQVMKPEVFDAGPACRADTGAYRGFGGGVVRFIQVANCDLKGKGDN